MAAVLGGQPWLPDSVEWPAWESHGPLSYIAAIDCSALRAVPLDIALPQAGMLLFFYFDGQLDDGTAIVYPEEPDTLAGARALPAPDTTPPRHLGADPVYGVSAAAFWPAKDRSSGPGDGRSPRKSAAPQAEPDGPGHPGMAHNGPGKAARARTRSARHRDTDHDHAVDVGPNAWIEHDLTGF